MKRYNQEPLYFAIVFMLCSFLVGCRSSADLATAAIEFQTSTSKPLATKTLKPSITPSLTVSPSSVPIITQTDTLSKTPLPTSTATLTPIVTIEPEKVDGEIRKLFAENTDCPFPCFWGIFPNKTTIGEAQNILLRVRHSLEPTSTRDGKEYYASLFTLDDGTSFTLILAVQENYVRDIDVAYSFTDKIHPDLWSSLSPETLVIKYGEPSKVDFGISYPTEGGFPSGTAWYNMVIVFENADLIVRYYRGLTKDGTFVKACPASDDFSGIHIWLGEDPRNPPKDGISLETATSLSLKAFQDLMTTASSNQCVDLKTEAFYP